MKRALVVALVVAAALAGFALTPPSGPRSIRQFDADRMAGLELRMWQAYYAKEKARLFGLLVTMLHEQYRYSWAAATIAGFHLARAAATFGNGTGNDDAVLSDLEAAYGRAKSWLRAGFDPRAVARAELDWWIARRLPGANSTVQVGTLMADEYALLYETSRERVLRAAYLRAEAAALRDAQAAHPDWDAIHALLRRSYRDLLAALTLVNAGGVEHRPAHWSDVGGAS
jgi:hypothetical protein